MKRRTWAYLVATALALAAVVVWAFAPRPASVETATVAIGPFRMSIEEDAKTRLRDRYVVSAPLAGQLDRIALREGDPVQAGQVLASLTPMMPAMLDERTLREQTARVDTAQAGVLRAQARIEVARVALLRARDELARSEALAADGFIASTKVDNDRLGLKSAQRELDAAEQDRHVAEHQMAQARAALVAIRQPTQGLRAFQLQSPVSGRVLRVVQTSQAVVSLGSPLIELGDTSRMEVVSEMLTTDAIRVAVGSPVLIRHWGGESALDARVRRIEPAAFTKISALGVEEQRVRVLIDITSPFERWSTLGDGYRVGVSIVTLSTDSALKVPTSAVFPSPGAPGFSAFVLVDRRARIRGVEVMGRNGQEAWVGRGLHPGEPVVVYPPSALKDGARVKVRPVGDR